MNPNSGTPKKMFSMNDATQEKTVVDHEAIERQKKEESLAIAKRIEEALKKKQEVIPTKMKPLEDRIIIKPDVVADIRTESGIYLSPEALQKMQPPRGTIVACGPGKDKPMPLKVGDRVLYGHYAGTNVEDPETKENYLVMRLADIFIEL